MKFVALNPYFVWQNEIIEHQNDDFDRTSKTSEDHCD
jgi:hypothetical protein